MAGSRHPPWVAGPAPSHAHSSPMRRSRSQQGSMSLRRSLVRVAVVSAAIALAAPSIAAGAESAVPTAQQKDYGLDWAPFIDPADLPPVEKRKIVCLVA